jgi:hypothetical protein
MSTHRPQNRHDPAMEQSRVRDVRLTWRSWIDVAAVASIAAVGFFNDSPWPVLLAVLLAIPLSFVTVPCYYVVYGLLSFIPEANPSSNTGSEGVAADGHILPSISTAMPAAWFTTTTHLIGILALTVAAIVNVLLLHSLAARPRRKAATTQT